MADEIFRSRFVYQPHEDRLYHELTQPTEDLILKQNAELRKNPDAIKKNGFLGGHWLCQIPANRVEKAIRDGYRLNSPDADIRRKELFRYLQSEEGQACLVRNEKFGKAP